MKNMKKLLSVVTVLGLTTVAGSNVVACGNHSAAATDLTNSFQPSYTKDITDATNLASLGLIATPGAANTYQFNFDNITLPGITSIITTNSEAPVSTLTVLKDLSSLPISAEGSKVAQVTINTKSGDIPTSTDSKKTVSYLITLKLWKATRQNDGKTIWVDQSTSMDVTLNINTTTSATAKVDITRLIGNQSLGQLSSATASAFLQALQAQLVKISGLGSITTADYNVYISGTTTTVKDSDVAGKTVLNVKIVAKGNNFVGTVEVVPAYYTLTTGAAVDITRLIGNQSLGQLSAPTARVFLQALQAQLVKISGLGSITTADYNVYITGSMNDSVQDSDVAGKTVLNVKIVAKGSNFTGTVEVVPAYYTLPTAPAVDITRLIGNQTLGQLSAPTAAAFLQALQAQLVKISGLEAITPADYDVSVSRTSNPVQDSDIIGNTVLNVKIVAKGSKFTGTVDVVPGYYSLPAFDISNKIGNQNLGQLSAPTAAAFLAALQAQLVKISGFESITTADYDVYKAQTSSPVLDSDITGQTKLNVKIVAKGSNFTGEEDDIENDFTLN